MTHLYIRKPVSLIRRVSQIKLHILIIRDLQTPQTHHSLSDQMNSLLSLYHQPEQQVASIMTPQCNFLLLNLGSSDSPSCSSALLVDDTRTPEDSLSLLSPPLHQNYLRRKPRMMKKMVLSLNIILRSRPRRERRGR